MEHITLIQEAEKMIKFDFSNKIFYLETFNRKLPIMSLYHVNELLQQHTEMPLPIRLYRFLRYLMEIYNMNYAQDTLGLEEIK